MPRRPQRIDPERQKWFEDLKKRDEIGMVDPVVKTLANYAPIAATPGKAFKIAAAADQLGLVPETQKLLQEGFSPAVAEALGYLKVRRPRVRPSPKPPKP